MGRLLGVRRSTRASKKYMAVFDDRPPVHFGASGYGDFIAYSKNPAVAKAKRKQYIARHSAAENWTDPHTPATLARYILWEKPTLQRAVRAYRARFRV